MKRLLSLSRMALMGAVVSLPLAAQISMPTVATRATESMTKMLNLSPDVAQKIGIINQDAMKKMIEVRGHDPKETMKVLKDRDKELKSTLTPDQWKTVQSNRVARASEIQTAVMANELNLNEAQLNQVSDLNMESVKQIQDAQTLAGDAKNTKVQSIYSSRTESLTKILSPEQLTRWQNFSTGAGKKLLGKDIGKFTGVPGL